MKRYNMTESYRMGVLCQDMEESPDGEWYSRADLIAAGVLVPVQDGEACRIQDVDERHHFIDSDGDLDFVDEGSVFIYPNERVRPVRLVRLEDVGDSEFHDKYANKAPHDVRG